MGRPARMGDSYVTARGILLQHGFEPADLAHPLSHIEGGAVDRRDAGRIVAPVLETTQGGQEDTNCLPRANVANDTAHVVGARVISDWWLVAGD